MHSKDKVVVGQALSSQINLLKASKHVVTLPPKWKHSSLGYRLCPLTPLSLLSYQQQVSDSHPPIKRTLITITLYDVGNLYHPQLSICETVSLLVSATSASQQYSWHPCRFSQSSLSLSLRFGHLRASLFVTKWYGAACLWVTMDELNRPKLNSTWL